MNRITVLLIDEPMNNFKNNKKTTTTTRTAK